MQARFYFRLSIASLLAMIASVAFCLLVITGRVTPPNYLQLVLCPPALLVAMLAMRHRDETEVVFAGHYGGLHPSNRRRALRSCFAPFRSGQWGRRFVNRLGRLVAAQIPLLGLALLSGLILPFAYFAAFLLALRRSAWLGEPNAILLEWDWFRIRGTFRDERGRTLAARAYGR